MPVDEMYLGPMLNSFRGMANDLKAKNASGEAFDRMMAALTRMEELGQEMNDFAEYSAKISTEGLQMQFSTAYGEVLGEMNKPASGGDGGYDDKALLDQTLNAYRDAMQRIKDGTSQAMAMATTEADRNEVATLAKDEILIKAIEDALKLGESGVTYPVFLRTMIEKGLDKAMEGSAALREGLEYDLGWARASSVSPLHIEEKEKILQLFDSLAEKSALGVPDSFEFELARQKIEHEFAPRHAQYKAKLNRFEHIISALDTWCIAHTKAAPSIDPWALATNPREAVETDKDYIPGDVKVREKIFQDYFSAGWQSIFTTDIFSNEVKTFRFAYSQEYTEFLLKTVYPLVVPAKHLPGEVVDQIEALVAGKKTANPELHRVHERVQQYYNSVFGAGAYEKKFSLAKPVDSLAAPWNLETFKAGA